MTLLFPTPWTALDIWIAVAAALCAVACALPGCYLVLRRMSMMGDAISHAVLPGLAAAFLLTGVRDSLVMLAGAAVVGVLTAVFTEWVRAAGRVDEGASMGVVFTVLFAIGLVLIRVAADKLDLDADCVLYGQLESVPLNTRALPGGWEVPRAVLVGAGVVAVNVLFIAGAYKELKISVFDPALARTLGIPARVFHYALMAIVAMTTVAAFESVGSILVIAMLIVPAAAAHLLTDRLSHMLLIAAGLAGLAAFVGHHLAISLPAWLGWPDVSLNTAGMMSVTIGAMFLLAMVLGPRHGWLARRFTRLRRTAGAPG